MLATLDAPEQFGDEDGWAFEMKWDGVRTVAYLAGGQVKLLSRKGRDDTAAYFDVVPTWPRSTVETAVLDGEVVVTDPSGRPDFGLLQHRINLTRPADIERAAKTWPAQLMLFDILHLNGRSLIKKPYAERREILEDLVQPAEGLAAPGAAGLRRQSGRGAGDQRRAAAGGRGGQAGRLDLPARAARPRPGSRSRHHPAQEVVIGGWRPGQGRRDGGVGVAADGRARPPTGLRYVGRVGSGFNDRMLDEIQAHAGPAGPQDVTADRRAAGGRPRRALGDALAGRRGDLRRTDRARPPAAPGLARAAARQVRRTRWSGKDPARVPYSRLVDASGQSLQPAMGRELLGLVLDRTADRLGDGLSHSSSRRLNRSPAAFGRQVPTISVPDSTAPGRPITGHSALCRLVSGTSSSRSRACSSRS